MSSQTATAPPTLDYAKTIGMLSTSRDGRGFRMPYSLAVSGDGRIFVLNRVRIKVAICTYGEEYLGEFASGPGDRDDQFRAPVSMAFDSQDRLHVTDEQNHRVSVFDSSGGFLANWGEHGGRDGQLDGPSGISFDSEDNAYVGDQNNHHVQVFDRDGNYLRRWGMRGGGDGQFNFPWGVEVDAEGHVYVADCQGRREIVPVGRSKTVPLNAQHEYRKSRGLLKLGPSPLAAAG